MVTKQPVIDSRLSTNAATVVRSLLIKHPRARLCCRSGYDEMKTLPWFAGLDWEGLYEKKIKMDYTPDLTGDEDVSSFETTFTREEAIDSITSDPSSSNKNKKKRGGLLSMFGLGGGSDKDDKEDESVAESFKDFGFVKQYENDGTAASTSVGSGEGANTNTGISTLTDTDATTGAGGIGSGGKKDDEDGDGGFRPAQPLRRIQRGQPVHGKVATATQNNNSGRTYEE
jgi:hypothetical protein